MSRSTLEDAQTEDQLEQPIPDPPPPTQSQVEPPDSYLDNWNGRSSKIRLAFPITFGDVAIDFAGVLGKSEACIHCKAQGKPDRFDHQLHLKVSRDKASGEFRGPEAQQFQQLIEAGVIAHTPQAAKRMDQDADNARVWGIEPTDFCRNCAAEIPRTATGDWGPSCPACRVRNGLPELRPRDAAAQRSVQREYRHGLKGAQQEEASVRREETARMAEAMEKGVGRGLAGLTEAMERGVERGVEKALAALSKNGEK